MSMPPHYDRSAMIERRVAVLLLILIISAVYIPVVNQQLSGWDDERFIAAVWKPGWQRAWRIVTDFDLQVHWRGLLQSASHAQPYGRPGLREFTGQAQCLDIQTDECGLPYGRFSARILIIAPCGDK